MEILYLYASISVTYSNSNFTGASKLGTYVINLCVLQKAIASGVVSRACFDNGHGDCDTIMNAAITLAVVEEGACCFTDLCNAAGIPLINDVIIVASLLMVLCMLLNNSQMYW